MHLQNNLHPLPPTPVLPIHSPLQLPVQVTPVQVAPSQSGTDDSSSSGNSQDSSDQLVHGRHKLPQLGPGTNDSTAIGQALEEARLATKQAED